MRLADLLMVAAVFILLVNTGDPIGTLIGRVQRATGFPQLVSYQQLSNDDEAMCQWQPASAGELARLKLQQSPATNATAETPSAAQRADAARRKPVRVIRDPYAAYSAVVVDESHNEVVLADENRFNLMVYNRLDNTPPQAAMTEPKRVIGGLKTQIEFQCDLYIDPGSGDIYAVNNDTKQRLVVFSRHAKGDVPADRELSTPYGAFGIAVDEQHQEMMLTVQHAGAVVTFHKMAQGDEPPIRLLQGEHTRLADPHGIALDAKNDEIFVANFGAHHLNETANGESASNFPESLIGRRPNKPNWPVGIWLEGKQGILPGSGKFLPPAITVYPRTASRDTAPLRVIEGPKTQMDWPTGIAIDPERGEIYVANDMGDSVLVFDSHASGDAAPIRVLKGPKSMIKNPTGVRLDLKNNELWTANYGNHTATVHRLTASGDAPPLRVIRSAPLNQPTPSISNPHAIAYDSNRDQILVPS